MTLESMLRALLGGALIGIAASLAFAVHGRIAGISGILARALDADPDGADPARPFRLAFLAGLVITGGVLAQLWPGAFGRPVGSLAVLIAAGLLVGIGTTLGNGCTSGHGVCGISRASPRSLVAVMTFMGTAMVTVAVARLLA